MTLGGTIGLKASGIDLKQPYVIKSFGFYAHTLVDSERLKISIHEGVIYNHKNWSFTNFLTFFWLKFTIQ